MVAASCNDDNEGAHWDYAVFTRDKGPSKFMRQKMRSILLNYGVNPDSLHKGNTISCWGEDMLGK